MAPGLREAYQRAAGRHPRPPSDIGNPRVRLLLVNPNTSAQATELMLAVARGVAPAGVAIEGATAPFGHQLISDEAKLATAAEAVATLLGDLKRPPDGVIVSAFGDPGLRQARMLLGCPVVGIAEAGMAEAAAGGRRFAVATTTGDLAAAMTELAGSYGHGRLFVGLYCTPGDPAVVMADGAALEEALEAACHAAIRDGAEAVVIGGGPLAGAARAIAPNLPVPIVEPVPAAVRRLVSRIESATA